MDKISQKSLAHCLQEAQELHDQVERLRALLRFQLQQINRLDDKLYSSAPGGVAARRLLALKRQKLSQQE
jgi:hypothetical protein